MAALVYETLASHPEGLTDWELLRRAGLPDRRRGSVVKRRQETGAVPRLDENGEVVTRLSPDGRPCCVWRLPVAAPDTKDA